VFKALTCLEESAVSSKAEMPLRFSLRPSMMAIVILYAGLLGACADAIAQETAPTLLNMTVHSTLWSFEGPRSNTTPFLVIGTAEREEPPPGGSVGLAQDEATNPLMRDTTSQPVGAVSSANQAEKEQSEPLLLSSLTPTAGVPGLANIGAKTTFRRRPIQSPPQGTGANIYSLLDDGPAFGTFLYRDRLKYLPPEQRLAHHEAFTHELGEGPRPLLQLDFRNWSFPVVLSGAAVFTVACDRRSWAYTINNRYRTEFGRTGIRRNQPAEVFLTLPQFRRNAIRFNPEKSGC
jgi:hypothetical protein